MMTFSFTVITLLIFSSLIEIARMNGYFVPTLNANT